MGFRPVYGLGPGTAAEIVYPYRPRPEGAGAVPGQFPGDDGGSGMSGDTELFEKPSNIKDLWAYEQRIILYIPYLGAAALKQPPFS